MTHRTPRVDGRDERYRQELTFMAAQLAATPWLGRPEVLGSASPSMLDARRQAASIALRDPPHAQQCVGAGTEQQLLQVADPFEVACLRCREDPLPQPPYAIFHGTPVDRVPIQDLALRSVHRHHRWWGV